MEVAKIVAFMGFPMGARERVQKSWLLKYVDPSKVELVQVATDLSEDEICEAVSGATVIMATPMTPFLNRRILEAAKGVKLVKFASVGYARIDLGAAADLGIPVANNAGVNAITVAEHAIMMVLVLQRKALLFHGEVMGGTWPEVTPGDMFELRGRTLGVLGLGAIGTEVAKIAVGFGAHVLYNKRNRLTEEEEAKLGVEYRNFEDLLGESDVISIHVPLTDETRGMIGEEQIAMMKDRAIVVNTARRAIVEEAALTKALREGKLYGVGIDVPKTSETQAEEFRALFSGLNAITTSHTASVSAQIIGRLIERLSECVRRVLAGEQPRFLVTA